MKKSILSVIFFLCVSAVFGREKATNPSDSLWSVRLVPAVAVPLGRHREIFAPAASTEVQVRYRHPLDRRIGFFLGGTLGYDLMPIKAESSISIVNAGIRAGFDLEVIPPFSVEAFVQGGYFYSFLNRTDSIEIDADAEVKGGNPFVCGGLGFNFMISPSLGVGLALSYQESLGLVSGFKTGLAASYRFNRRLEDFVRQEDIQRLEEQIRDAGDSGAPGLDFESVELAPVFPVFHKYYDDHPVGRLVLVNNSSETATDIRIDFFVRRYMDDPKQLVLADPIPPDGKREVDLYALFTDKILEVSEGTKVSANIVAEYQLQEYRRSEELIETLRIHNRNAIAWDDDRKAAAFVTAKDHWIQKFAKITAAGVGRASERNSFEQLHTAMAVFQALSVYGLRYEVDPVTPYEEFSRDRYTLDYLQFPLQTLEYKAGDCDDLSILYNALLEAVGIETAFLTVPGHIFVALCLEMNQQDAWRTFHSPDDLIFLDNKIWLPVELTVLNEGFVKAWILAARMWREHAGAGRAGLISTREAWQIYEPVAYPVLTADLEFPSQQSLESAYRLEVNKFIEREIGDRVAVLQRSIADGGETPRARNQLGVLFARYGLHETAEKHFRAALEIDGYFPALMNLGNLCYLEQDYGQALSCFERAQRQARDNPKVFLALARVHHELENFGTARSLFAQLKQVDPDLASRFSYLELRGEESVRAADLGRSREAVLWEEEK